jgi:2'-5' RNA ligase
VGGDTAALRALQASFAAALASLAAVDDRAFHAHVTLGRCKSRLGAGALWRRCQELSPGLHRAALAVPSVTLYRSELRPQGPVHTPLLSRPLPHQR